MQIRTVTPEQATPPAAERPPLRARPAANFKQLVAQATAGAQGDGQVDGQSVTVKRGDTLMSLTRSYLGSAVGQFSNSQIYDMARTVARENGITNPDRIMPGQTINMAPMMTMAALKLRAGSVEAVQLEAQSAVATPVLDKTLARAVSKGYLSPTDQTAVRNRILSLASEHHFSPEDFARMTLMESDGMNPRASNGSCHGIIQFCAGGNRGAASAGFAKNPKEILKLSVLQQLDLVDRYFTDTRLKDYGPAALDDLYLTVLTPGARSQTRPDVPLAIAGRQAAHLYEGRDQNGVITRNSIVNGLMRNARERLGEFTDTMARLEGRVM